MTKRIALTFIVSFLTVFPSLVLLPSDFALAQCVGTSTIEDFVPNMKGCAVTVSFAARAATCSAGWHVCSASEWTTRFLGKTPKYTYWTNDTLRYNSTADGCFVSTSTGTTCNAGRTMHVCAPPPGDRDGAYATPSHYYLLQTFLPAGTISVVTSIDLATAQAKSFGGQLSPNSFNGNQVGGAGSLTLFFQTGDTGTDGSASFTKLANPQASVDHFTQTFDPLGNSCNWHNCGLGSAEPNLYFGGCDDGATAGVLCCQ